MKYLLITFTLLLFASISAQDTLKLKISNREPRVGDELELSFSFDFFTNEINSQFKSDIEMSKSNSIYGNQNDEFTRIIAFKTVGQHVVGPFKFDFNGGKIVTDSIIVDVIEKLPFEEGLWIRLATDQYGSKYLIVEQLIQNVSDKNQKKRGASYTVGGVMSDDQEFVEITGIDTEQLNVFFKQSSTTTIIKDNATEFDEGLSFSYSIYEIEFMYAFKGKYVLQRKNLKNLPKKSPFKELIIER